MIYFKPESRKSPEEFTTSGIEFVGEQKGFTEQEFKNLCCELFAQNPNIKSAYLARVHYRNPNSIEVAICISSSTGEDHKIEKQLGEIFSSMFHLNERLDIIFISREKEIEIQKVCRAFYRS